MKALPLSPQEQLLFVVHLGPAASKAELLGQRTQSGLVSGWSVVEYDGGTGLGLMALLFMQEISWSGISASTSFASRAMLSTWLPVRSMQSLNGTNCCNMGKRLMVRFKSCIELCCSSGVWPPVWPLYSIRHHSLIYTEPSGHYSFFKIMFCV